MAGRYDDKKTFIERLDPLIQRQLEIYRQDPDGYVRSLPTRMHSYFVEHSLSRKVPLACLLAESLIATHRAPTAAYIWKLMHENVQHDARSPEGPIWQPQEDHGLGPIKSTALESDDGGPLEEDIPF
jgi:hypothetical protein